MNVDTSDVLISRVTLFVELLDALLEVLLIAALVQDLLCASSILGFLLAGNEATAAGFRFLIAWAAALWADHSC